MIRTISFVGALALGAVAGCASYPMPVQRLADAEAASRSATDLGAATSPQGQLHLKLAQEEIAQAKQLIANNDNERADYVLIRAKADAELAVAEAKDTTATQEAQHASNKITEMQSGNNVNASVTTTTSGTIAPTPGTTPATSTTMTTTTTGGQK